MSGVDIDGNNVSIEVDDLRARLFQHELDHLDGVLMVEHLTEPQHKQAKKILRDLMLNGPGTGPSVTIAADGSFIGQD